MFKALNNFLSPVFDHRYGSGSGTLHTIVCTPAERQMQVGVGGDAEPAGIDLKGWVAGAPLGLQGLTGQLGGTAKPFDPGRRVSQVRSRRPRQGLHRHAARQRPLQGPDPANATFANVSLAGAKFDDIDFSNTVITSNCNFAGMRIAGVDVKELFAAYEQRRR